MMQSVCVIFVSALALASSLPAGVYVSDKGEVGASWNGFSASAGLGVNGGGLHAEAGTPNGPAAGAGLGGSVAGDGNAGGLYSFAQSGSSASATGHVVTDNKIPPTKIRGTVFDDIFNIPQSVLRSVNDLLNKRAQGQKVVVVGTSANAAGATASEAGLTKKVINVTSAQGPTRYDDIFNIPQSVLGAVNRLLNRL